MFRYIIFGVSAYLIFTVYFAPASLAYSTLQKYYGQQIPAQLNGVSGSVWSGAATSLTVGSQQLGPIKWHFRPFSMFLGRTELAWEFEIEDGYGKGVVGKSLFGNAYLHNVEAWLPALQAATMANMAALKPGGSFAINVETLEMSNQTIESVIGVLTWHEAEVSLLKPLKLGGLEMRFEQADEGIIGVLADQGGPLQAEGKLIISDDGKFEFEATLAARDATQTDLKNALSTLGKPDRSGKYNLKQIGDLSRFNLF